MRSPKVLGKPLKRTEVEAVQKVRELQRRNWQAEKRLEILEERARLQH